MAASSTALTSLSIKLTVQARTVQREADRYRRTVMEAKKELEDAAKRGNDAAALRSARKQANARKMHEQYSRIGVDLDHAAAMVKSAAIAGRITDTMRQVTTQLVTASSSMDVNSIESAMQSFREAMSSVTTTSASMESTLGDLGCSSTDEEVRELIKQASDVAGIELCAQFIRPPRSSLAEPATSSTQLNTE